MKILVVTTISDTINSFLLPHIKEMVDSGHRVEIATNISQSLDSIAKNNCSRIYNIPFQRNPISKNNLKSYKYMKLLAENDYDIVHTHTPVASLVTRWAFKNQRKKGTKVIYTAHGFHFHKGAPLLNWLVYYPLEKIMSTFTDSIITINSEDYLLARNKFRCQNIHYIPGVGVNTHRFEKANSTERNLVRTKLGLNMSDIVLTYIGELNKNKNQKILLHMLQKLNKEDNRYKLLLIGDGHLYDYYDKKIIDLELQDNVLLLGRRKDIVEILSITDIYVASSKREGLPVNIIEAMSIGLPIVASDNRGHRDLITHNINGYLYSLDNEEKLIELVTKLSKNPNTIKKFSSINREKAKEFNIKNILKMLEEIYEVV